MFSRSEDKTVSKGPAISLRNYYRLSLVIIAIVFWGALYILGDSVTLTVFFFSLRTLLVPYILMWITFMIVSFYAAERTLTVVYWVCPVVVYLWTFLYTFLPQAFTSFLAPSPDVGSKEISVIFLFPLVLVAGYLLLTGAFLICELLRSRGYVHPME